jgi:hypothetical protein
MVTYLDKIRHLYPNIQQVMYWHAQQDGKPWEDPYEGIIWENTSIPKPSKEDLDAIPASEVENAVEVRKEIERKTLRDSKYSSDLTIKTAYLTYKAHFPNITLSTYLDLMEAGILEDPKAIPEKKETDPELIANSLKEVETTISNLKGELKEINEALTAHRGFLMIMPELQKALQEINDQLQKALKETNDLLQNKNIEITK